MSQDTEIVVVDIGGTHARFALAQLRAGRVVAMGEPVVLQATAYPGLAGAWAAFAAQMGRPLPRQAAIALACPVSGAVLQLTNNPWTLRTATLAAELGLERHVLVNDFGAIGHAVAQLGQEHLLPVAGPRRPLPEEGVISIVGPGTGLGIAQVVRRGGRGLVVECEGSHIGFAPQDAVDDALLARLRARFGRVSAERVVCGAGLGAVYETLADLQGQRVTAPGDKAMWTLALGGQDGLARAALERFCTSLGAVAGDMALAHGAQAVVLAGGLGLRLAALLPGGAFAQGFTNKGRLAPAMREMPVWLIQHPQPGLLGAAAAFVAAG